MPDAPEIALQQIAIWVCALCLAGKGGECHVPGCAYWMHDAPDDQFAGTLAFTAAAEWMPVDFQGERGA